MFRSFLRSSSTQRPSKRKVVTPTLEGMENRIVPTFSFELNFSFDKGFISPEMKLLAKETASYLSAKFQDSLIALPEVTYRVPNPSNPNALTTIKTSVGQNQLLVYVAGAPLSGKTASYSYSDFDPLDTNFRGQASDNDFAPNVSVISLDNDGTTQWDLKSEAGRAYFRGVFTHELVHSMGVLTKQPTWASKIEDGAFKGDEVTKLFPAGLAVEPGLNPVHFAAGSNSLMTPQGAGDDITDVTSADMALLKDLGWEPVTENLSLATAQPILSAGEKADADIVQGLDFSKIGGYAIYRFEALTGFQYEFSTEIATPSMPKVDTFLRLFDSQGNQLAINDDGVEPGSFSVLTYRPTKGGTYYIGLSLFSTKNYILSPSKLRGDPSNAAGIVTFHVKATDPLDIGGSTISASDIPASFFVGGSFKTAQSLSDKNDVDLYKVTLDAYESIIISTGFSSISGGRKVDTYLRLFSNQGREVLSSDDGGGGNYAKLSFTSKTGGVYYFAVSSTLNRDYSLGSAPLNPARFGGDYALSVTRTATFPALRDDTQDSPGTHYLEVNYRALDGTWFVLPNILGHVPLAPQKWGNWDQFTGWLDESSGDFNGDGAIDRIGRTPTGQWWLAKNLGSSFETVYLGSWNESLGYQDVQFGNFFNVGGQISPVSDIAARDKTGTWYIFPLDSGVISEDAKVSFATVNPASSWKNVTSLDYDHDGRLDILGRDKTGAWLLLENTGSHFDQKIIGRWNEKANWKDVEFFDFSGDGLIDIAGREASGQWWVSGNAQGGLFSSYATWKWNESAGWRNVMLGDFAGDSRLDIIGRTSTGEWWVAPTTDNYSFLDPKSNKIIKNPFDSKNLGRWNEKAGWTTVLTGNFIGGGKADLIGLTRSGQWWISENKGTKLASSEFFPDKKFTIPAPVRSAATGYYTTGALESGGQFSQAGLPPVVGMPINNATDLQFIDRLFLDSHLLSYLAAFNIPK